MHWKYKFELRTKYDRENDFDLILGCAVPCRKVKLCMLQELK